MYRYFTSLNAARSAAGAASSSFYTTQMNLTGMTQNELLIAKGPLVSLLSNRGSSSSSPDITIPVAQTNWAPNTAIIDAVSCQTFTTNAGGDLVIQIENGLPRVLIADAQKGKVCDSSLFTNQTSVPSGSDSGSGSSGGQSAGFKLDMGFGAVLATAALALAAQILL
jgi:alpha-amylase